ncbi:hypothetical protein [Effusibacillus dendaii]|uniref:Uncharacterized protein n=1 Tax=Effusibacillus dendaii TaxID=2743772 RepID=A0A7I8DJM5_9BACL|nr:hypothetical protein [Effusibacillus dendaii]BCJ88061.1 hypothetical protein skT53_30460 [Effusibacillus dendaii]
MTVTYARVVGWLFVVLGTIGFFKQELLGLIQFDRIQNIIYLMLGILGLAAVANQKNDLYAICIGMLSLLFGLFSIFQPALLGIRLETIEIVLFLTVGGWGVFTGVYKKAE